jgi:hypothetical protein
LRKITAALILLLAVLSLIVCEQGGKKVRLLFKYKPGMTLRYRQETKGTVRVFTGDSTIRDLTRQTITDVEHHVRRIIDDSTAEIVENKEYEFHTFNRIDSSRTDTVEQGKELVLYVAPNGKIVDLEVTGSTDTAYTEYLRNFYEQGMPVFPANPISQGYKWTQTYKVVLEGEEMEASTTYEAKMFARERGYDCVVLDYDGNLILPIKTSATEGYKEHGVNRINTTGVMYFAYKEGFVVLQKERWVMDGDRTRMHASGKNEGYQIAVEYDVVFELTDYEPST